MEHFSSTRFLVPACLAVLLACGGQAVCGEKPDEPGNPAEVSTPSLSTWAELPRLIRDLDDESFKTREHASVRLAELAKSAGEEEKAAMRAKLTRSYKRARGLDLRFRLYGALLKLADAETPDKKPGFLGIQMMDSIAVLPGGQRVTSINVRMVIEDSAAETHGIKIHDHIVSLDGERFERGTSIANMASARFGEKVRKRSVDSEVVLEVYTPRTRSLRKLTVKLGERPEYLRDSQQELTKSNNLVKEWLAEDSTTKTRN